MNELDILQKTVWELKRDLENDRKSSNYLKKLMRSYQVTIENQETQIMSKNLLIDLVEYRIQKLTMETEQ